MCQFCVEHGEGKKWYLQAKNYSLELFNEERKRFTKEFFEKFEEEFVGRFQALEQLKAAGSEAFNSMMPVIVEQQKKDHWGQVVPIEEVEQIVDLTINITRLPCACRSATRGLYDARYCFGMTNVSASERPFNDFPDWTGGLEVLTNDEAKRALRKLDRNGLVHSVWTFITPFIYGVCNCTAADCLAMRGRLRSGATEPFPFFKAEYVATIDWEDCNVCRDCFKNCNFGAIRYSPSIQKCYIDQFECYGCGVCRAVCTRDAISLKDRNAIPALAKEW